MFEFDPDAESRYFIEGYRIYRIGDESGRSITSIHRDKSAATLLVFDDTAVGKVKGSAVGVQVKFHARHPAWLTEIDLIPIRRSAGRRPSVGDLGKIPDTS